MTDKDFSKINEIKRIIERDLLAADIKLSLFISAAISFKQDSLLSPFPKAYLGEKNAKDFERLVSDLEKIPGLEEFLVLLMGGNTSVLSDSTVNLLHWILTSSKYNIKTVPRSNFDNILGLPKKSNQLTQITAKPSHIFEISYVDSGAEQRFQLLKSTLGMDTKYAYHGTRFYNMYPILNYGLQQHLNKTGLFGEGLYFAQELDVSLLFSPSVLSWTKSKCGNIASCVAICEYINDPLHVKVRKENAKNSDIPQSYLLITNNEYVRVRYILVYGSKKAAAAKKPAEVQVEVESRQGFLKWCRKNPLIVSGFLYVLLLALVGMSNHRAFEYYKDVTLNFLKNRFKFL